MTWLVALAATASCSDEVDESPVGSGAQGATTSAAGSGGATHVERCADLCGALDGCAALEAGSRNFPESLETCQSVCAPAPAPSAAFLSAAAACVQDVACDDSLEIYVEAVTDCLTDAGATTALVVDICGDKLIECGAIGPGASYESRLECVWAGMAFAASDPAGYAAWQACMLAADGCAYDGCGALPGT